jgi:hypothetical protein
VGKKLLQPIRQENRAGATDLAVVGKKNPKGTITNSRMNSNT